MADEKRFENEDIQKGLEDFIDRELTLDYSLSEPGRATGNKTTVNQTVTPASRVGIPHSVDRGEDFDIIGYQDISGEKEHRAGGQHAGEVHRTSVQHTGREEHRTSGQHARDEYRTSGRHSEDENRSDRRRAEDSRRTSGCRSEDKNRSDKRRTGERTYSFSQRRMDDEWEDDRKSKERKKKVEKKMSGKKNRKSKKNDKKKKKNGSAKALLTVVAILFILIFGGLYMLVGNVYKKMNYVKVDSVAKEACKEDGVVNVLLIGNDSRLNGDDGRSDAMILISISDKTKTITMTSFLRDMYVDIPGHDGNRLNAAYSYGGAELLMQTIEQNFDIPVHRYALVNFEAFANLVDAVGGIDLDVTNDEVQLINGYLMEYNQLLGRNLDYDWLDASASGVIHLNGPQALAYSRNRYIGTDFGRTERQRKVLSEVFKKLPGAMVTNSSEVINGLFPNLTTNLTQSECYKIALGGYKIVGYDMVQQCVPQEGTYSDATIRSMAVLQVDFDANKKFLKQTIYGE